nr:hypothetical protein [Tanacetum cinerariifolium]
MIYDLTHIRYEHFSTTLTNEVTESSTKNLVPIPRECEVTLDNGSESIEPVKDDSSVFTTFLNPLFNNDGINSDELESHVESNFVESTSNHDTMKIDNLDEFLDLSFLFTLLRKKESGGNMLITSIVWKCCLQSTHVFILRTDDVLPPGVENDDDSDREVDDLRVDNSISNSKHKSFESKESDFDIPSVLLSPPEPPDKELDFEIDFGDEISVVRNTIVEFECIDARVKFDDYSYFMFDKFNLSLKNDIWHGAFDFHQRSSSNKAAETLIHGRNDGIDIHARTHPHSSRS